MNSALLGSAYMAKHGIRDRNSVDDPVANFQKITSSVPAARLACTPYSDSDKVREKYVYICAWRR